jgi:two-component system, OmpR family, sensor kinase
MKLISKTTLIYWAMTLLGFSVAGIALLQMIERELLHEADEELHLQHELVASFLTQLENPAALKLPYIQLRLIAGKGSPTASEPMFGDTLIGEDDDEEDEIEMAPYRQMQWRQQIGQAQYEIKVFKAMLETEDAVEAILLAMIPVVIALSLLMGILMRFISKALWKPFYAALHDIGTFRPEMPQAPRFPHVHTLEFAQLNASLQRMTDKVCQDYQNLKIFAENAAHELQTPLAIAQNKIEILLQSTEIGPEEMGKIVAALEALQRIKRLNEGLLTLSKIENQQYAPLQPLAIHHVLTRQVSDFEELAALRNIAIHLQIQAQPQPALNPTLVELLLGNLLSNALRHNRAGGCIEIVLDADTLTFANTANAMRLDPGKLFQRFQRQGSQSPGAGLGLAIAHEICNTMRIQISYDYQHEMHIFKLRFPLQN